MWWCGWLRHCTTNQKIMVSFPVGLRGLHIGCTMALGSTQSLTEMGTRNISWRVEVASA